MKISIKSFVWIVTLCMLILNITKIIDVPWLVVFAPVLCWYSIWIISIAILIISFALYGVKNILKKKKENNNE